VGRKIASAHLAVARSLAALLRWGVSRSAALLLEMVAFSPFRAKHRCQVPQNVSRTISWACGGAA
jgi:hypothetical protein